MPAGTTEPAFKFLDDFAVSSNRPVEPLQVAIDHKEQIVEFFPGSQGECTQRFRFIRLAISHKKPNFTGAGGFQPAAVHVFHEAGLVDSHHRPQPHGHCWKFPEIGHQPGVRIRGQPPTVDFPAKMTQLLFTESSFYKSSGIDTRRAVPLKIDHIGSVRGVRALEEPVKANFVYRRYRCIGCDMATEAQSTFIGSCHHRHSIPAHKSSNISGSERIPGDFFFLFRCDGIAVWGQDARRS